MTHLRRTRGARTLAVVAAGALALAGCTSDAPASPASPGSPPATSSTQSPSDGLGAQPLAPATETSLPVLDAGTDDPFPANLEPDFGPVGEGAELSPTGMRFGVHDGYDRVVIDLSGSGSPGWTAEYTDTPTADGSGERVDLAGDAALEVRIDGVVHPTEEGAEPWEGSPNVAPQSAGVVEHVVRGPLFEGTQQIFVGLGSREPFRAFSLEDPTRVVIDVHHPSVTGGDEPVADPDPSGDQAPFPADLEPDTAEATDDARLSPVDLRFGVHDGFDRIVLDVAGPGLPGWLGRYVSDPSLPGSGSPVELAGEAALQVHVRGVVYPTADGAPEYRGPQRFRPGSGRVVEEVVYGAVYEGQAELYVGLSSPEPFRVFRLEDPTRVVIDVLHPDITGDDPGEEEAPFTADRLPDTAQVTDGARLSPVDLRFAVHEGFDRVVLDLEGQGLPGWRGEYVDNPTQQAAGEPVYLLGDDYLLILVRGVRYPTEPGAQPFAGPRTITPTAAGVVRDVRYGAMVEGQLEIWVGLSSDQPFRVFRLEDPTRVVIDMQHP
ncbi:hypothetical protein [Cellulomonas sp. ATA003]|uniref:AMIN-like domain-containing (lipo)protein n=1 Tax=Cellulomonas sp. ATA003 TaxID=3073064 RepID=UPI0028733848|nr:hypothetical protein [Cellulomonas sp. ATA003]WNB84571.1 hypothetical protein REH70_12125 [Cellulomonas sp. ATA003]